MDFGLGESACLLVWCSERNLENGLKSGEWAVQLRHEIPVIPSTNYIKKQKMAEQNSQIHNTSSRERKAAAILFTSGRRSHCSEMALVITKLQRKAYEKAGWTKDEDILLVRLLDKHACRKKLVGKERVYAVLEKCAARMTEELGRPILVSSLVRSLVFIWDRYKTFKSFIESPGVGYSIKFNRVYARAAYWQSLAGRNEVMSVRNMRKMGEPLYPQLLNIFSYGCCFAPPSDAEDWGVGEEYSPGSGDESDAGDNKTGRSDCEESGSN